MDIGENQLDVNNNNNNFYTKRPGSVLLNDTNAILPIHLSIRYGLFWEWMKWE